MDATPTIALTNGEVFSDPSNNPFGTTDDERAQGYASIYAYWRVADRPPSAKDLALEMVTEFHEPIGVIGVMMEDAEHPSGVLKCLHALQVYPGQPGKPSTDRSKTFAYVEDVDGIDITTVKLDEDVFSRTNEINIAGSAARHQEVLDDNPDEDMVGPYDTTTASKQTVRTRNSMCIPHEFVPLVIDKGLSGRQAFEILVPAIEEANMTLVCDPLVKFLMVASTNPSTQAHSLVIREHIGEPGSTIATQVLKYRRETLLYKQVPHLRPAAATAGDPAIRQIADGLDNLVAGMRTEREEKADRLAESKEPKSVRSIFGDRIADRILMLTESLSDEDVPEYYLDLANRPKKLSERVVLQEAIDRTAAALGTPRFSATPSQALAMRNWSFVGDRPDMIGVGLMPFTITPPESMSPEAIKAIREDHDRAETFDLSGEHTSGNISSSDAKSMRNNKGYRPVSWSEARMQLRCMHTLAGSILGDKHRAVQKYGEFLKHYDRVEARLSNAMTKQLGPNAAPAVFLFHVHLMWYNWFQEQTALTTTHGVDPPDFMQGLKAYQLTMMLNWLPNVAEVDELAPLLGSPAAAPSHSTNVGGVRAAAAGGRQARGGGIRNPTGDPRFVGRGALATSIRARPVREAMRIGGDPPAVNRNGNNLHHCISWHCKGQCVAECE